MIELTLWDYSNITSKLLIYIGVAAAIGGPFVVALIDPLVNKKPIINYIFLSSGVGLIAVIGNFFIQVGAFSEDGFGGMFDIEMVSFLWESSVGDSVFWRLLGFVFLVIALCWGNLNAIYERFSLKHITFVLSYLGAIFSFAYSFTFIGHSSDIGGFSKWLVAFHVTSMAWWIGALYPLWFSCKLLQPLPLSKLMRLWGRVAMLMVGLLIACGIGLLFLFFADPLELLTTQYGQAMLLKLTFVATILLLAAYHKFHLVEQGEIVSQKLGKSIRNEMCIAVTILIITATLSYVLGPATLA